MMFTVALMALLMCLIWFHCLLWRCCCLPGRWRSFSPPWWPFMLVLIVHDDCDVFVRGHNDVDALLGGGSFVGL